MNRDQMLDWLEQQSPFRRAAWEQYGNAELRAAVDNLKRADEAHARYVGAR